MIILRKIAILLSTAMLLLLYQNCGEISEFEVQEINNQASMSCPLEGAQKRVGIDEVLIEDMIVPISQVNEEALKLYWPEKYAYLKSHSDRYEGVKTAYDALWDDGQLSLYFHSSTSADAKAKTLAACEKIGSFADIKCRVHEDPEVYPYVEVTQADNGCFASVGKRTRSGYLNIKGSCATEYIILHELMHVLGVKHEHQHPERDKYIRIIEENISPSYLRNFSLFTPGLVSDFDLSSIMLYRSSAFSKGGSYPAMVKRSPECDKYQNTGFPSNCTWGDRKGISAGDKEFLIALYGPAKGPTPPPMPEPPSSPPETPPGEPETPTEPPAVPPSSPVDPVEIGVDPEEPEQVIVPIETCPLPEPQLKSGYGDGNSKNF